MIDVNQPIITDRSKDLRWAITLTYTTLVWMIIEAVSSIWLGIASNSLLLEGFGSDSVIELASAGVLLWRLKVEWSYLDKMNGETQEHIEAVERKASRFAGYLLYILALYLTSMSITGLISHRIVDADVGIWGMIIGLVAKFGMPVLAGMKLKVAARLESKALRADAMEAVTCSYLSIVLMIGLAADKLLGWWWLDSAATLALIPFLIKEGREAITGVCTCSSGHCDG